MKNSDDSDDNRNSYNERDERIASRMEAKLYRQDGEYIPVLIENLSRYGIRVESDIAVEIGEAIRLMIDELGEFEGVVRWSRPDHFGVHMADTIDFSLLNDRK